VSSPRDEPDEPEILSGVFEGRTTGAPVCILIRNRDARTADYEPLRDVFRPGTGDFTWFARYGVRDWRGGGRLSGRETAARVAAGAVAKQVIAMDGIRVVGHTTEVAGVTAETFDATVIESNPMRCADPRAAIRMLAAVLAASNDGDSVGGIVETFAEGVPPGLGDPVFGGLDAALAGALMSIPGVKGVEIGDGFAAARLRGSAHNDAPTPTGFASNHAGGILGGISNGAPIRVRLAVKPTPSIALPQRTMDTAGDERTIAIRGRHDPCLCPRIVPVAEAMMAVVLADALLRRAGIGEGVPR
jgi:chorismate synthase